MILCYFSTPPGNLKGCHEQCHLHRIQGCSQIAPQRPPHSPGTRGMMVGEITRLLRESLHSLLPTVGMLIEQLATETVTEFTLAKSGSCVEERRWVSWIPFRPQSRPFMNFSRTSRDHRPGAEQVANNTTSARNQRLQNIKVSTEYVRNKAAASWSPSVYLRRMILLLSCSRIPTRYCRNSRWIQWIQRALSAINHRLLSLTLS